MDDQLIERAVEAAAKANFDRYTQPLCGWETTPEQVKAAWRGSVAEPVIAALAEVEASIKAVADSDGAAMDLWWKSTGDDWPVPEDLPGKYLHVVLQEIGLHRTQEDK